MSFPRPSSAHANASNKHVALSQTDCKDCTDTLPELRLHLDQLHKHGVCERNNEQCFLASEAALRACCAMREDGALWRARCTRARTQLLRRRQRRRQHIEAGGQRERPRHRGLRRRERSHLVHRARLDDLGPRQRVPRLPANKPFGEER